MMHRSRDSVEALCARKPRSQPYRKPRQNGLDAYCSFFSFLLDRKSQTSKGNGNVHSRKDSNSTQQPTKRISHNPSKKERKINTSRGPNQKDKSNPCSLTNENGNSRRRRRKTVSPPSGSALALGFGRKGSPSVFPKKLRIKIVSATHMIHIEDTAPHQGERLSSPKKPSSDLLRPTDQLILQENFDEEEGLPGLQMDSLAMSANVEAVCGAPVLKPYDSKDKNGYTPSLQWTRKSSRVPKRHVMNCDEDEKMVRKRCRIGISEESAQVLYQFEESREVAQKEPLLTARQRSLQSTKEGMPNLIEFPQGLPLVTRKQKNTLTEAEKQAKKEEAAQRRRVQLEKAARELQDQAIQKVLSQDSARKKREIKQQKQREEKEEKKNVASLNPPINSLHIHMGPSGTILSFSKDMDLSIFSGPCSYPKEREKCAGPACTNTYKYRDSKSKLPLCSLECYKAVRTLAGTTPAC